jgi:hypothetical protein
MSNDTPPEMPLTPSQTGSERPKFRCEVCAATFARREHLNRHSRSHTKEKPFRCNMCKKNFTRAYVTYLNSFSQVPTICANFFAETSFSATRMLTPPVKRRRPEQARSEPVSHVLQAECDAPEAIHVLVARRKARIVVMFPGRKADLHQNESITRLNTTLQVPPCVVVLVKWRFSQLLILPMRESSKSELNLSPTLMLIAMPSIKRTHPIRKQ